FGCANSGRYQDGPCTAARTALGSSRSCWKNARQEGSTEFGSFKNFSCISSTKVALAPYRKLVSRSAVLGKLRASSAMVSLTFRLVRDVLDIGVATKRRPF